MRPRKVPLALALLGVLAALALTACGGGGSSTDSTSGGAPVDLFAKLGTLLRRFPYTDAYRECLLEHAKGQVDESEVEEFAGLPEAERQQKTLELAFGVSSKCEKPGQKAIDPNGTPAQMKLLRAGYVSTLAQLAAKEGFPEAATECVAEAAGKLSDAELIVIGNGSEKRREAILLGVFKGCAKPPSSSG
jgi:hypothetical protein